MSRLLTLTGASAVVLLLGGPVSSAAETRGDGRAGTGVLEEVVTTATKRSEAEAAQDLPLAVTVLDGAEALHSRLPHHGHPGGGGERHQPAELHPGAGGDSMERQPGTGVRPWGFMTLVTRRLEDENTLIWEYPGQSTSRLRRVCRLPGSEVWTSRSGGENTHLPRGISTGDPAHA